MSDIEIVVLEDDIPGDSSTPTPERNFSVSVKKSYPNKKECAENGDVFEHKSNVDIADVEIKSVPIALPNKNEATESKTKPLAPQVEQNDSSSDDDILIDLGVKTNNVPKRKSQITDEDIENLIVKCSACGKQVNHHYKEHIKKHRHLGVLICKECFQFYSEGEFSEDDTGYNYCRWCAQGGKLYGCDFCPNTFCFKCVHRNFGRGEARRIQDEKWKCYVCEPSMLKEKVAFCDIIMNYVKKLKDKKVKKLTKLPRQPANVLITSDSDDDDVVNAPSKWLPFHMNRTMFLCSKLLTKLHKLKSKHAEKEKSTTQIVAKYNELVDTYFADINGVQKSAQNKYNHYVQYKKKSKIEKVNLMKEKSAKKESGDCSEEVINISDDGIKSKQKSPDGVLNGDMKDVKEFAGKETIENNGANNRIKSVSNLDSSVVNNIPNCDSSKKNSILVPNHKSVNDLAEDEIIIDCDLSKETADTGNFNEESPQSSAFLSTEELNQDVTTVEKSVDSVSEKENIVDNKQVHIDKTKSDVNQPPADDMLKNGDLNNQDTSSVDHDEHNLMNESSEQASKDTAATNQDVNTPKQDDDSHSPMQSQSLLSECLPEFPKEITSGDAFDNSVVAGMQKSIDELIMKNEAAKQTLLTPIVDSESDSCTPSVPETSMCSRILKSGNKKSPKNKMPLEKGKKYKSFVPKKLPFEVGSEPPSTEQGALTSKKVTQKQARTEVSESSLSSLLSSSDSEVIVQTKKSKCAKKFRDKTAQRNTLKDEDKFKAMREHYADFFDDPKLVVLPEVYVEKLLLGLETDSDMAKLPQSGEVKSQVNEESAVDDKKDDDFDATFRKLSSLPKLKKSATSASESDGKGGNTTTKKSAPEPVKKPKVNSGDDSCSEPFTLSSSSEGEEGKSKFGKNLENFSLMMDKNELAKASLLGMNSSSDASSDSDIQISPKKIAKGKGAPEKSKSEDNSDSGSIESVNEVDSEDDFKLPKKKGKYDKLLRVPITEQNSDPGQKEKQGKKTKEKKRTKRKIISSDEDGDKEKKKDSSTSDSSSDSSEDFKTKRGGKKQNGAAKKRKRIKELDNSSNSDGGNKSDGVGGSQDTPGNKGRKNIRKIISDGNLKVETKEAEKAEKERRRRVVERQKLYNQITEEIGDRGEMITKKMVLEVDPDSKEEVVEIHPDLVEKLKPHQVNGVKFMWECTIESLKQLKSSPGSGCILAHCMGLGKTLQVIAFLYTVLTNKNTKEHLRTALVICPYNTVLNWAKEFEIWLEEVEDSINIFEMAAAKDNYTRKDVLQMWQDEGGVLIIGYDIFRRMVDGKMARASKKLKEMVFNHLADPGPDIVICDEGHILKNETSAVSKATNKLKTQRRIVLTGTPLQNNLKEYHCMVHFVKPHLLGTTKEFRNRFVNPIINGQCADSSEYDVKKMKKRVHILHKLLQGCVQRCDYSALTTFLPDKHEFVISVKLSDVQIKMYSYFLETLAQGRSNDGKVEGRQLFKDYNSLKNIWTHPYVVEKSYIRFRDSKMYSDTDSEGSLADFIDDGSSSSKSDDDEVTLILEDNEPSTSKGKENNSSGDEIIHKWKTRSRSKRGKGDPEEEVREAPPEQKHWWDQFLSEEDHFKLELSGKMVLVFEILKECELIGDKVLIFSTSLLTLDLLEQLLAAEDEKFQVSACQPENVSCQDYIGSWALGLDYFRMDGSTNIEMRKRWIEIFNDKENERARLFMISTKAGGLGTNLVGANRVIMLDASWNPSHDVQAIFRVFRFGQVKPVYIYRLLAQGTMEEKIYDRQVTKLSLQCRVIDEQNIERHFNASDLAELYKFDPEGQTNRPTPMVPKDRLLAELLIKHKEWIVTYHEHDSLLQNVTEDDLTEEERQTAWQEYENEREGLLNNNPGNMFNTRTFSFDPNAEHELPDADQDVKRCVQYIKSQNPTAGPEHLLNKGIAAVANLKRHYGEILNRIRNERIRISQTGPVPETMDAYIDALVNAISKTDLYAAQLKQQFYAYTMAKNAQWRAQQAAAQQKQQQWNTQQQFANAGSNYSFAGRGATYANFPRGTSFQTQNFQTNASASNPVQGVQIVQLSSTPGTGPSGTASSAATSSRASNGKGPIITEVIDNTSTFEQQQTQPRTRSTAKSTVTITELD